MSGMRHTASVRYPTPKYDAIMPVLAQMFGAMPCEAVPEDEGGYSPAGRWSVRWADGRSAFVKAEPSVVDDPDWGIRSEHWIYANVASSIVPVLLGFAEHEAGVVLAIEDLSAASWGVPLTQRDATLLGEAMDELETLVPPPGLPDAKPRGSWRRLAAEPAPLLATGLCDRQWLDDHVEALAAAEDSVDPSGTGLIHRDVWLQNWCRADRGAVLVDWAGAARGNPLFSRAFGEAGVRAAGGPEGVVMPAGHPGWAALMAGSAAADLSDDGYRHEPRLLETQRREAAATIRWACDELSIPVPAFAPGFAPYGPWRP